MRTQCVLQIPKACKKMSLACSLRWRVDDGRVRRPLYSVHCLRCLACVVCALEGTAWGYITGFPLPSRCGPSNYRTAGVLLQWNYSDTADANFDLTHVKTDKYEGTETIIPKTLTCLQTTVILFINIINLIHLCSVIGNVFLFEGILVPAKWVSLKRAATAEEMPATFVSFWFFCKVHQNKIIMKKYWSTAPAI